MTKSELRNEVLIRRKAMSETKKREADLEIQSRLLMTEEYRECETVLVYVATQSEIDTKGIIRAAFANKKRVAVPVTNDDYSLSFYYINSFGELKSGRFGILEPKNRDNELKSFENSVCVIPALCCDLVGNRIGYGKGCYDRFLSNYNQTKIALVYSENVYPLIESEETDVRVDVIVSDTYVKRT